MFNISARITGQPTFDTQGKGAIPEATKEEMKRASRVGFQVSQIHVPVDTGELELSGVPPFEEFEGGYVWGYDAPHALPVEYGSAPHWPPIKPLLGWARRVLGDESAAYAVQRKIANEGTEAQPYVRPGFRAMKRYLRNTSYTMAIQREVRQKRG